MEPWSNTEESKLCLVSSQLLLASLGLSLEEKDAKEPEPSEWVRGGGLGVTAWGLVALIGGRRVIVRTTGISECAEGVCGFSLKPRCECSVESYWVHRVFILSLMVGKGVGRDSEAVEMALRL